MAQQTAMTQRTIENEPSLGELFSELAGETSLLVRQEVALAQTEITAKISSAARDAGLIAAGGVLVHAGLFAILAAIIIGLAAFIPAWIAALLVGLAVIGVGAMIALPSFNRLKNTDLTPRQTVETLKEDAQWLKNQVG